MTTTMGRLGAWELSAGVAQAVYACDKTQPSIITLNVCNRNNFEISVRIAISSSQTAPENTDWIEYDTDIAGNGSFERTSIMVPTGKYLVVRSNYPNVTAMCWGVTQGDDYVATPIVTQTGSALTWITPDTPVSIAAGSNIDLQLSASDPDGGSLIYSLTDGSLPAGSTLYPTGKILGSTSPTYTPGITSETSTFTVSATDGNYTVPRTFSIVKRWYDGSTSSAAAPNALSIKSLTGTTTDGTYWINLPTVGPTQVFCIMNTAMSGGGWMMMMKATRGTTFAYSSSYWTSNNTLNTTSTNRTDADAKFNVMNYFVAKDAMALWPDLANGGDIGGQSYGTIWVENNWYGGNRIVPITFFNSVNNYNPNGFSPRSSKWNGGSQFSSQSGAQAYGFNLTYNANWSVRWGFQWNNEGDWGSNDVGGGIGMNNTAYSAGDYIACCNDVGGFNRTARVEMYVR